MNESVERHGRVLSVDAAGLAQIRLEPQASCASCGSRGTCGSASGSTQIVRLPVSGAPAAGQEVCIVTAPRLLLVAGLLGYALPAVGLVFGAMLAESGFGTDAAAVVGALAGLLAGLLTARLISRLVLRRERAIRVVPTIPEHHFYSGENA